MFLSRIADGSLTKESVFVCLFDCLFVCFVFIFLGFFCSPLNTVSIQNYLKEIEAIKRITFVREKIKETKRRIVIAGYTKLEWTKWMYQERLSNRSESTRK